MSKSKSKPKPKRPVGKYRKAPKYNGKACGYRMMDRDPDLSMTPRMVARAYIAWCEREGLDPYTQRY